LIVQVKWKGDEKSQFYSLYLTSNTRYGHLDDEQEVMWDLSSGVISNDLE